MRLFNRGNKDALDLRRPPLTVGISGEEAYFGKMQIRPLILDQLWRRYQKQEALFFQQSSSKSLWTQINQVLLLDKSDKN